MYAIVEIAGQQLKVEESKYIYTQRLNDKDGNPVAIGESLVFDNVMLLENGSSIEVGQPRVSGAKVTGQVLAHVKGDKVIIFKKKRRKGYQVWRGHRQQYTKVLIEKISK